MSILYYLLGAILLATGRKLYWFFTAVAGMFLGILLSNALLDSEALIWRIVFAVIGAALGAFLAVALQKLTIGIVGFVAGALGAGYLWQLAALPQEGWVRFVPYILGGILAASLVIWVFEYSLIILTSWAGATLISRELALEDWLGMAAMIGLLITGLVIQSVSYSAERKKKELKEE